MSEPFRFLTPRLAVAGQLSPQDMLRAQQAGFKAVVNNRPDAEETGQPVNAAIQEAASQLGLEYHFMPVVTSQITDEDIEQFGELFAQLPEPVLLFCRTGTRCTYLWALSQSGEQELNWLSDKAREAGYDLDIILPRMQRRV